MDAPGWTTITTPAWLWGANPAGLFEEAGLRARRHDAGTFLVRAEEHYAHTQPDLIRLRELDVADRPDRLPHLGQFHERAETDLDFPAIQRHLDEAGARAAASGDVVHALAHAQGVLMATPLRDLESNARAVLDELRRISWSDGPGEGPFAQASLTLLATSDNLLPRLRLPSIFLRLFEDPLLREGDPQRLQALRSTEGLAFPSSHSLYEGVYMFQPYVGPLQGAMTPSVWCIAAPRTFGTLLLLLSRGISGTRNHPVEPLQLIGVRGPSQGYSAPPHALSNQLAAAHWWAGALNDLFGVLSDPATFADGSGDYDPSSQLRALLTIEQLFRRVTSLVAHHRDLTARQVLMYTCADTLEGLTGKSLLKQFSFDHAHATLRRLRAQMPQTAQSVLLTSAERAVPALAKVQDGFVLAKERGHQTLKWGAKEQKLESAVAYYLVALRNATHGHGGGKGGLSQRERDSTLLVQHTGNLPDDLFLLPYLYLLELLSNPKRLRTILAARH